MNLNLTGKNALVCGSSKGIGKASALALAELGASVTLIARSADLLADVIKQLKHSTSQNHDYLVADLKDRGQLKRSLLGLSSSKVIHILVNNAGGPRGGLIHEAEIEDFESAFDTHLMSSHLITKMLIPKMKAAKYGRIINIISTSVKSPIKGLGVSNTTRGAMANWSKTLSYELAEFGITVNNVLPGATDTDRLRDVIKHWAKQRNISYEAMREKYAEEIPVKRFASPEELANVVAFLASPAAAYINGTNIAVDGGRTLAL